MNQLLIYFEYDNKFQAFLQAILQVRSWPFRRERNNKTIAYDATDSQKFQDRLKRAFEHQTK